MDRRLGRTRTLFCILMSAAALRLWMHAAAMPPYAGLDELHHVARVAFVAENGRSPTMREPSVPPYLAKSIHGDVDALPAFGQIGARWPEVIGARPALLPNRELQDADRRPYVAANYEAQQPHLYYAVAAQVVKRLPHRTPLGELQALRALSVLFAVLIIAATGGIAYRIAGRRGLLVAVWLLSTPTWHTLVVRAGNDALACALIALGYAVTLSGSKRPGVWVAEAAVWLLALATKLYAWPAAVALPIIWHAQKAPRARRALVLAVGACAVAATVFDLAERTNNPLGHQAFDSGSAPRHTAAAPGIDYGEVVKIIIASFAWTSGQHWNALRPLAIVLYLAPVLLLSLYVIGKHGGRHKVATAACVATFAAFTLAQGINLWGFIRQAKEAGLTLPAGGKEGWYWYSIAPLLFGLLGSIVCMYARSAAIAAQTLWLVAWDVLISEGALYLDYAGKTSPQMGDALFRWGPRMWPFADGALGLTGVGPGAGWLLEMRVIQLFLVVMLALAVLREHRHATGTESSA